jgi:hypothetical protein
LDNVLGNSKWFTSATESAGSSSSGEYVQSNKISVNAIVQNNELILNWSYSKNHFENETIEELSKTFKANLESLIVHCIEKDKTGKVFTPSDYGLGKEISYSELDNFLKEEYKGKPRSESIEGIYRLSGLQQGMLFHGLYDDNVITYNRQLSCTLQNVNIDLFRKSWNQVLKNHSALRSAFYSDSFKIPVQAVYKDVEIPVEVFDYSEIDIKKQTEAINKFKAEDHANGFDFESAPLMRISLIRLSDDKYRMFWTWHHILFDGWSMPVMMEEFLKTYESLISGNEILTTDIDRYEDFISYLDKRNKIQEETYWRNYLKGLEQSTFLPFAEKNAERNMGSGIYESISLIINESITAQIQSFAQQNHLTINTIIQGVWSYLLHQYTGNGEVAYGIIVSGRPDDLPGVEQRVGMYINTLPLHSHFEKGQNIKDWLQVIQKDQVSSRNYQYSPLQDVQKLSGVNAELFDSLLVFENYPVNKIIGSKKWSLKIDDADMFEQTNYPLTIAIDSSEHINIGFSFNSDLLKKEYVELIRNHFENVLLQMIENADRKVEDISVLTNAEEQQLLVEFNESASEYPIGKSTAQLFEEQVLKTPDNVAVVFEDEQLSYKELDERSNQLANYLIEKESCRVKILVYFLCGELK